MGYRGAIPDGTLKENHRLALFEKISLQPATKQYWLQRKNGWVSRGFILLGRWEGHFQKLGVIFRDILKCDFSAVFEAQTLQEQIEVYEKNWPKLRWKSFMKIAASEYVFNKFLYQGHFSGGSHHRTEKRAPSDFLIEEFDRIFRTQLVRKNYFMQVLFLGKIRYEEGLPFEAWESTFQKVKSSTTQIHYHVGNLLDVLPQRAWDFISLSDTISYLPNDRAENILQELSPATPSGSRMVIRSFLRAPQSVNSKGWKHLSDKDSWALQEDGTGVYRFHIYEKE
jgi:S-adenosylmethionine-diacylglycerol 3-amino-3-carboxypropyl transferase